MVYAFDHGLISDHYQLLSATTIGGTVSHEAGHIMGCGTKVSCHPTARTTTRPMTIATAIVR